MIEEIKSYKEQYGENYEQEMINSGIFLIYSEDKVDILKDGKCIRLNDNKLLL